MIRQWFRRAASLLLAAVLMASAASAAEIRHQNGLQLQDGLSLAGNYAQHDQATVREQILTYVPGGAVQPVVVYGNTLYGRSTMEYIQEYLTEQGYTAAAAVNAAFFDMNTGIPYGMVVTDGILRSSGDGSAVGILEDGTLQIGKPDLEMKLTWAGGETVLNYNKALSKTNGFCLYSQDYDWVTKHSISGYNLGLRANHTDLTVSDKITATVVEIAPDSKSCEIPEDGFVLSLAMESVYTSAMEQMKQLEIGDTLTITVSVDEKWNDVVYSVGGGDMLVENGRALTEFELNTADKEAARTALGIKSNGEVVCYTADKGSSSDGLTLAQLAQRMQELGCVTAVNLDGGGSTTLGATLPGETAFAILNEPADGAQRPCANFLFFVRPTEPAGAAVRLHVYPYDAAVLPGGQVDLSVKATDANYFAADVPTGVTFRATGGSISGTTFTAEKVGTARITASANGLSGSAAIEVIETPTTISVYQAGQETEATSLIVEGGTSVDLSAKAEYLGMELAAQDRSFTWTVPAELGTITEDGVFTASENYTKGNMTVSCGDLTLAIPIEVRPNPFADTANHWARTYITQLYYQGVLQGSSDSQGVMRYRPDDSMTRQEFVVAMLRAQDLNLQQYADTELPFADADQIADWAKNAVKAAYALGWFTGSGSGENLYANPNETITREAAMTILARTISASSDSDALEQFADDNRVSDWARPALTAMVERGIIDGMDGKLLPLGNITRGQVAKILFVMQ